MIISIYKYQQRLLVLLLVLFFNQETFSQNSAVILGKGFDKQNGKLLKVAKPIGNYPKSFYKKNSDDIKVENGQFVKELELDSNGFVTIYEDPYMFGSFSFFVEKGDSIIIEQKKDRIEISGNNSAFNNLYTNNSYLKVSPDSVFDVLTVLKKHKNADDVIKNIDIQKQKIFNFYQALHKEKKISANCLKAVKAEIDGRINFFAGNYSENGRSEETRKKLGLAFDTKEAQKLVEFYNSKYSVFSENSLYSTILDQNLYMTGWNMEAQAKKTNKKVNRFWNQFDELFKSCRSNFGVIDFLEPEQYKEIYIASCIFESIRFNCVKNKKDLIAVYRAFIKKYPESNYNTIIENLLFEDDLKQKENNNSPIGSLSSYDAAVGLSISNSRIDVKKSFEEAIAEKYPNQNLFIDFWATYCSPCIKQFEYNDELHLFLNKQDIKTIYVTIDNEASVDLWKKMISDYSLVGYHLFASEVYRNEKIMKEVIDYVPHYFVYNYKTKKITLVEGYPSEKQKFYDKITASLIK